MKKQHLSTGRNVLKFGAIVLAIVLAIAFAAVMIPTFAAEDSDGIAWRSDFGKASVEAKKEDKNILLRFSADWCPPCRVMDANVWPKKEVSTAVAKDYIPVEIDIDADGATKLARHFGVRSVPTIITLDAEGEVLGRNGFMRTKDLLRFLKP